MSINVKRLSFVGFVSLFINLALASAETISDQDFIYPYKDPIDATISAALLNSSHPLEMLTFKSFIPGRSEVPYMEGRDQVQFLFAFANESAPLIFLQTGIGATESSGLAAFLAEQLNHVGFNVVTLPSPFYWRFALGVSRSGTPGVASEDSEDIYQEMKGVLEMLRQERGLNPKQIGFLGYSLGAAEGAQIAMLDARRKEIGFSKFLLINPPVNLRVGIQAVDAMADLPKKYGQAWADRAIGWVMNFASELKDAGPEAASKALLSLGSLPLSSDERHYLIGWDLRSALSDTVLAGQSISDLGIFPGPADEEHLGVRGLRAGKLSYSDYVSKFVLPSWSQRHHIDLESTEGQRRVQREMSLNPYTKELGLNQKISVMHNQDDFLMRAEDFEWLKQTFGDRLTLYPRGGHCGNLWSPVVLKHVIEVFAPLL